ncbi:MAG: hypothetical protein Q9209_005417 [Squamulea sp. 1 TL-2023]
MPPPASPARADQRKITDLRTENTRLRSERSALQDRNKVLEHTELYHREEIRDLTNRRSRLQVENDSLRNQLSTHQRQILAFTNKEKQLMRELNDLRQEKTELKEQNRKLRDQKAVDDQGYHIAAEEIATSTRLICRSMVKY